MLFWIACALLTAGVIYALVRPLRSLEPVPMAAAAEARVYRDQLSEIDADLERGLISAAEADAARLEVSRRLLASSGAPGPKGAATGKLLVSGRTVAIALAAGVPVLSLAIYLVVGSPGILGEPLDARERVAGEVRQIQSLVSQVETRLRLNPDDGQGWDLIAPVYLRLERFDDAAQAFKRAYELRGESAPRLAGYAAAIIEANGGTVTEPARLALGKVLQLDPTSIESRFWLAIAQEQAGDRDGAAKAFRQLLDSAPPGAPWRYAVEERLRAVTGAAPEPGPASNPDAAGAIAGLAPAERAKAIAGMVDGLAQRLKADGSDLPGWQRLIRAYTVMGDGGKARTALADARKALAGNPAALSALDATARELGLGG